MSLLAQLDYQESALDQIAHHLERGVYRQAGVLFTGGGKTSGIAAHMPRRFEHLVRRQTGGHGGLLFIVHRREILKAAAAKFKEAYPNKWIGIEMGEEHCVGDEDFIFASVDSLGTLMGNRIVKMQHRLFGVIITDEAHHLTINSKWDNVLNFFGVGSDETQRFTLPDGERPLSLLLTATPNRTDGKPLTPFLDPINGRHDYEPVFEYNLQWGIRNGWAVDIRASHVVDESGVSGREQALDTELDFLSRVIRDYCRDSQTLVFSRSVDQSEMLAKALNKSGIVRAGHIDGKTNKQIRSELLRQFAAEELSLMTNFGIFTEGTDIPNIQTILMNRAVQSPVDFPQMVGRGTRPDPIVYTLKTPQERLAAIAASSKPFCRLICTFSYEQWQSLKIVAKLTGKETDLLADEKPSIMEIVDVIEYMEEEMPEVPLHGIKTIDDLKVSITEVNPWKSTVYNEKLKAMSPLSWVQQGESVSLWMPENPFSKAAYDQVPVIVRVYADGDTVRKELIEVGGFNKVTGKVRRAARIDQGEAQNVQLAVAKLDRWLRSNAPATYQKVQRGGHEAADPKAVRYLKRNKIQVGQELSQGSADLLMAHNRIKTSLEGLDS